MKICTAGEKPLCCLASYEYSVTESDGRFSLGVFEGIHFRDGSVRESMGFALCTILKCNSNTSTLCDSHVRNSIIMLFKFFLAFSQYYLVHTNPKKVK